MPDEKAAKRRKPSKADVEAALGHAVRALWAEPGAYTATEPTRITVSVRNWDDRPWRYNKRTPPPPPPPSSGPPPPKGATMNQTPTPEPLPTTDPPLEQPDTGDNDDDSDEEDE